MSEAIVVRCPSCGAPLSQTEGSFVVKCFYCDSECRLASKEAEAQAEESRKLFDRIRESEDIQRKVQPKIDELNAKMSQAMGDGRKQDAVRYFEGIMRLETMSSQKLTGDAFDYLDQVVTPAVRDFARSMGIDYSPGE